MYVATLSSEVILLKDQESVRWGISWGLFVWQLFQVAFFPVCWDLFFFPSSEPSVFPGDFKGGSVAPILCWICSFMSAQHELAVMSPQFTQFTPRKTCCPRHPSALKHCSFTVISFQSLENHTASLPTHSREQSHRTVKWFWSLGEISHREKPCIISTSRCLLLESVIHNFL